MVRLTFFAVAAAAVLATFSLADDKNNATALSQQFVDDDGVPLTIIDSGGDLDDDDDEPSTKLITRKHHHKHSKHGAQHWKSHPDPGAVRMGTTQITWYASHDLLNPACSDGGWAPKNSNHIGAVMQGWEGGPACGSFVQICNKHAKGGRRCVKVRVVDKCAGCGHGHVDLTKSAFKRLSPSGTLTEGRIHHLGFYKVKTPNPFDRGLFGPFRLRN